MSRLVISAVSCLVLLTGSSQADHWPAWRGPRGDGSSLDENTPTVWNGTTGENITWKVPVPGNGHGSPIVWENRVFLAACDKEKGDRVLTCYDRATGETIWTRTVFTGPLETKHNLNSFASCTPATSVKQ